MKNNENNKIIAAAKIVGKQVCLIVIALVLATISLAVSGYEPFAIVNGIFKGLTSDIAGTVRWATPLVLAGLAICVTYKAEVFNLGVDGQLYMGAAAATAIAVKMPSSMNHGVSVVVIFLAAMVAGALFAMIPAMMSRLPINLPRVIFSFRIKYASTIVHIYVSEVNGKTTE